MRALPYWPQLLKWRFHGNCDHLLVLLFQLLNSVTETHVSKHRVMATQKKGKVKQLIKEKKRKRKKRKSKTRKKRKERERKKSKAKHKAK